MISDWKLPERVKVLNPRYHLVDINHGVQYRYRRWDGMSVIMGMECHDGRWWLHVSCAKHSKLPTWNDLKEVKESFIGIDKKAIQILPEAKKYVNIHPYCLHLYHCPEDGLPDFTIMGIL